MKIYNETSGTELTEPDLGLGYLYPGRYLATHHDAVDEVTHLAVMPGTEALNGGAGLRQIVVDTPAEAAWDEYEDCQIYHAYTAEELAAQQAERDAAAEAAQNATTTADRLAAAEAAIIELAGLLAGGEG